MSEARKQPDQALVGAVAVVLGVILLAANLLQVNVWPFVWPLLIIALGAWLVLKPRLAPPATAVTQLVIAEISRDGSWQVQDESFWALIADIDLNLARAAVPLGETNLHFSHFVGEIDLLVPEDIGVRVDSSAFVCSVNLDGHKVEHILSPLHWQSDHFEKAKQRLHVSVSGVVAEVKLRRV